MLPEVIAEFICKHYSGRVIEVGIGYYWKVAEILADKGFEVIAIDSKDISAEFKGRQIKFVVDDIMNPNLEIYEGASLVYSIRPPLELYSYIVAVARAVDADCLIRPFGNEFAIDGKLINYKGERFYVWFNRR